MKIALRFFLALLCSILFTSASANDFSFISLTTIDEGSKQKLLWKVQNEETIVRYEVERYNLTAFVKIGEIIATGTGDYTFLDEQLTDLTTYRIRAITKSNTSIYREVDFYDTTPNVFRGTGDWFDVSKWSKGKLPLEGNPLSLYPIPLNIIEGHCTLKVPWRYASKTGLEIASTGTLTIKSTHTNFLDSVRIDSLIIKGQLYNEAILNSATDMVIEEKATLTNTGQLKVGYFNLATLQNKGRFINSGIFIGRLINHPIATSENSGKLAGNTTIGGNLSNTGTLAPGNSPGVVTITGDYTATPAAVHEFEVGGTTAALYDRLIGGGAVNLNGKLEVTIINGYSPGGTDEITLMTGAINGKFSETIIPPPYTLVYSNNSVMLKGPQVLPVTFVNVSVKKEENGNGAKLTWDIKEELNVATYEVERSAEGRNYQLIGKVTATGQSKYTFTDATPLDKGIYRVKSVDFDGTAKYSTHVRYFKQSTVSRLQATPALVRQTTLIHHPAASSNAILTLCSLSGQKLILKPIHEGNKETLLDLHDLKAGTYMLHFQDGKGLQESIKIIKH